MQETESPTVNLDSRTLARAIQRLMTGGNGVASALIGIFGPDVFTEWQSFAEAERECQQRLGDKWYEAYELWQMWFVCMQVRDELDAAVAALP